MTGKGFYWGCTGTYDVIAITGSYEDNILILTFEPAQQKPAKHVFRYEEDHHRPRFCAPDGKSSERIIPGHELD